MFSSAVVRESRLNPWKTNPILRLRISQPRNLNSFEQVAASAWLVEAAYYIHECGFAAAAGAHDGNKLSSANLERDASQRMNAGLTQIVYLCTSSIWISAPWASPALVAITGCEIVAMLEIGVT